MRRPSLPPPTSLLAAALSALLLTALTAAPASAHTRLVSSTPAQGLPAEAPSEVVLVFNEPVRPGLSALSVRGDDGEEHVAGSPTTGAEDGSVAQALHAPLDPGSYTVAYRVLASDGHPVTGSFEITAVAPAAAPRPPSSDPTGAAPSDPASAPLPGPTTDPASDPSSDPTPGALAPVAERADDGGVPVLPLVVGGLVIAAVGGLLARRRGGGPRSS